MFELRLKSIGITKDQAWTARKRIKQGETLALTSYDRNDRKESTKLLMPGMEPDGHWELYSLAGA